MKALILTLSLLTTLPAFADSLYRWVDEAGRVHYSDQPPPPKVKKVTQKSYKGSVVESGDSYALREAKDKYPVTLYTSGCGPACDMAQQLLDRRGIPYSTRNVENNADNQKALRDLTGNLRIPSLVVGSQKLTGFEDSQWNGALDSAGYPKTPAPNAPKPKPAEKTEQKTEQKTASAPSERR
jgi:glutaredoxin